MAERPIGTGQKPRDVVTVTMPEQPTAGEDGWQTIDSAPKDGTEIWAYTTEGAQRVVHWEEECPSGSDDPGHDAGWMSDDGTTHPSCFYHKQHPPTDPPTHWRPLPSPPGEQVADVAGPPDREAIHLPSPDNVRDEMEDALQQIEQWADAYPETMFRPISSEKLKEANNALKAIGVDMGAMHAGWARHIVDGIGKIARTALRRHRGEKG